MQFWRGYWAHMVAVCVRKGKRTMNAHNRRALLDLIPGAIVSPVPSSPPRPSPARCHVHRKRWCGPSRTGSGTNRKIVVPCHASAVEAPLLGGPRRCRRQATLGLLVASRSPSLRMAVVLMSHSTRRTARCFTRLIQTRQSASLPRQSGLREKHHGTHLAQTLSARSTCGD